LKDHADVAPPRGHVIDGLAVEANQTFVRLGESGDHPQQRGFTATAGAEKGEELAPLDVEIDVVDDPLLAVTLADIFKPDIRR
jgi:hypothetical protein